MGPWMLCHRLGHRVMSHMLHEPSSWWCKPRQQNGTLTIYQWQKVKLGQYLLVSWINLVGPIDISPLNVYPMQWTTALVTFHSNSQYALDRTSTLTPLNMVPGNSPSICGGVIPTPDFHKKGWKGTIDINFSPALYSQYDCFISTSSSANKGSCPNLANIKTRFGICLLLLSLSCLT